MNNNELNRIARDYAEDILREIAEYGGEEYDLAYECIDSSEHVIYHSKAHDICQNCDTTRGEQFLEDIGNPDDPTYDSLATLIAYGELLARTMEALEELKEEER